MDIELTKQEQKVYDCIMKYHIIKYKMIANKLNISHPTVCTHIQHIYSKKNVSSMPELIFKHFTSKK